MPFDPNFPPHGAELVSAEFREQFNAAHDPVVDHEARIAALEALATSQAALIAAQAVQIAALQTALLGTAQNPNVGTFSTSMSDPPSRDSVQAILDVLNALITQLTRV